MARRGGGGNRSAAAKKGWETRRRAGAKGKSTKITAKSGNDKVAGLKRDIPLMVESIRATRRQIRSGRNPGGDNLKAELGMRKTALRNRIKQIRSEQPKQARSARKR